MMLTVAGWLLGFIIGGACRQFDIPVPAPPTIMGATLVMVTTLGYFVADHFLFH